MRRPEQERLPHNQNQQPGDHDSIEDVATRLSVLEEVPSRSPEAITAGRRTFLLQAARLRQSQTPVHRPQRWTAGLRLAMIALLLALGLAAGLSRQALPGAPLYSLKLALEDTRLALTHDPQARSELALDLADTRIEEMLRLAQAGRPIPPEILSRLQDQLQLCLDSAARLQGVQMEALLARLHRRAQERTLALQQALAATPIQEPLEQALGLLDDADQWAALGLSDPARFRQERGQPAQPTPTTTIEPTTPLPSPPTTPQPSPMPEPTPQGIADPTRQQHREQGATPGQTHGAGGNHPSLPTESPSGSIAAPTSQPHPTHTPQPTHAPKTTGSSGHEHTSQPTHTPRPSNPKH